MQASAPRFTVIRPLILLLSDTLALALSLGIAIFAKAQIHQGVTVAPYAKLWPFTFVFLASYWMSGLYSRVAMSQPEDLERGAACSCCIFLSLSAATLSLRGASKLFTFTLVLCLIANLILMPLLRELCRHIFSRFPGWGYQAVIFGSGRDAEALIERSLTDPGVGIRPVAVVDPSPEARLFLCGLPIVKSIDSAVLELDSSQPAYGILTVAAASSREMVRLINAPESIIFSRIVLLANPSSMSSMWAIPLSKKHKLYPDEKFRTKSATYLVSKRLLDIFLALLALIVSLPVMVILAAIVKLDSPGPWLFGHKRIGRDQKHFKAWKFRTMRVDGDQVLQEWFAAHPEAKDEWLRYGKLKQDPRVTRVGRFLRGRSLDELPQLWNVLRGEMSLVGPRPIVESEVHHYGEDYDFYSQVQGGVTGMWQVSGRSSTSYRERVMLDTFYVSNWSIWLDLAILIRTVGTVLLKTGAC
jgi:Undecaprenyl-phosphate galactose phosphotransferase WbaP